MIYHNDNKIKFQYNRIITGNLNPLNAVGTTENETLRSLDFTPSDSNSIFVSKAGNDFGLGTQSDPVKTIAKAISKVTLTLSHVVILDSGVYEEYLPNYLEYPLVGIYAALGAAPTIKPKKNCYFNEISLLKSRIDPDPGYGSKSASFQLSNGNICYGYKYYNGTNDFLRFRILRQEDLEIVISDKTCVNSVSIGNVFGAAIHNDKFVIGNYTGSASLEYGLSNYVYIVSNNGEDVIPANPSYNGIYDSYVKVAHAIKLEYEDYFAIVYMKILSEFYRISLGIYDSSGNPKYYVSDCTGRGPTYYIYCINGVGLSNGNIMYLFQVHNQPLRLRVHDHTGAYVNEMTVSSTTAPHLYIACIKLSNGNIFVAYSNNYKIYNASCTAEVIGETQYTTNSILGPISAVELLNGHIAIVYQSNGNKLCIIDINGEENLFDYDLGYNANQFSAICNKYNKLITGYAYGHSLYHVCTIGGTTMTTDIEINGLKIDFNNQYLCNWFLYNVSNNLTVKWCEICNCVNGGLDMAYAVKSYGPTTVANCKIYDNDSGFYIESNNVNILFCQAFKNVRGEVFRINGASSNIQINHCDFLYNSIGIKLENNDGNEVIKNSIFYKNAYFGIDAETQIEYTNSVSVDIMNNAVAGVGVVLANPQYINDGFFKPADINLNLRRLILGYKIESPAIDIGDDGKSAGSLLIEILGIQETWDTIEIYKPTDIEIQYEPVNEYNIECNDGSIISGKDGVSEVVTLKWETLINADFAKVLALYTCKQSTVKIYFDPISYPLQYGIFTLVQNTLNGAPKYFKLSRTGVQNVEMQFKRQYNVGP